jgi:hypothetical protein
MLARLRGHFRTHDINGVFLDRSIEIYELDGKIFSLGISKFFQPLFQCCPQWSSAGLNTGTSARIFRANVTRSFQSKVKKAKPSEKRATLGL